MPATRVTIALNSKQSQKAPLLIPASASTDPASTASCRDLVIKTAQSKLRLKRATRIFAAGGRELKEKKDWDDVLKDDVILLLSAGEEYVGSKKENTPSFQGQNPDISEPSKTGNSNCSIEVLANNAFIDSTSIAQLETTTQVLPGIIHAVAQPDLHPGTKFPIGAVFVSEGWIHPPLIGGDIGCGMAWYKTKLSRSQVDGDKGRKIAERLQGLEGPWRNQQDREVWLRTNSVDGDAHCGAGEEWDASLGTIGAGNHFGELQTVEESMPAHELSSSKSQYQLYDGEVVLLVHSGSRGYGGDILKRYTTEGQTSIHESEPVTKLYLQEHDRACNWASRNRDLIALRFLACLEPGEESWDLGLKNPGSIATPDQIHAARAAIKSRKVVDIWHNNVESISWPPQPPSLDPSSAGHSISTSTTLPHQHPHQNTVYVHRKGAAPIISPSTHLPLSILPLPGSRGTPTLILHPTFTPLNAHGRTNALSLAHGAGRAMSRAKASAYVATKYKGRAEDLLRGDFVPMDKAGNKSIGKGEKEGVHGGVWVVCEDRQLVWEEAPEAYKDVWAVGGDLVEKGCAERWGWCRGVVSYKVRRQ